MSIKYVIPEECKEHVGEVAKVLMPLLTNRRIQKMQDVLAKRSRQVCAVFENTHHAHNVSAVLRTMESFGFLDVFFIYDDPDMRFRPCDAIDRSSSKWLTIRSENSVTACAKKLKENGYKIALVSRPDFSTTSSYYQNRLPAFSTEQCDQKNFIDLIQDEDIALIFGTELHGLSSEWGNYADFYIYVDMFGFCESLNVSVCAAIVLYKFRAALTKYNKLKLLSDFEKTLLFEHWIAKDTEHALKFISEKYPKLLDWYMHVRSAKSRVLA